MSFVKTRVKAYIVKITPEELTKTDKHWLDKALEKDYDGTRLEGILDRAKSGWTQLWRLGNSEGIIVTDIIQRDGGWQLWLPHMAGSGILKRLNEIEDHFVLYGQRHGCNVIRWAGTRPGTNKLYSERWKEIARIYERKL